MAVRTPISSMIAYRLDPPTESPEYAAILKSADVAGVEIRDIRRGSRPGCSAYVIVPPSPWKGLAQWATRGLSPVEYALALRRYAPLRNCFLWYTRSANIAPTTRRALTRYGTTPVHTLSSFLLACAEMPRLLTDSELRAAQSSLDQREARFRRHQLRRLGEPALAEREELVTWLRQAIARRRDSCLSGGPAILNTCTTAQLLEYLDLLDEGQ